jgi:hypothetical protein
MAYRSSNVSVNTKNDRGASAILIALLLLLFMGMAAIAVDLGLGFNERRLDQTAADNSALAAGVELIVGGGLEQAVEKVVDYTDDNLGRVVTPSDWEDCEDPDALQFTATSPDTECISFGQSSAGVAFNRVRVKIPGQTTDTTFARVLGVFGITTSAEAEVQLENALAGGSFPAAVFNGAGAGDEFCIKTGTGSANKESCGAPSTGDFGNFQPYFYTELSPSNPSSLCTSGNQPAPLSRVIADGLDHELGITATVPGDRRNGADCPHAPGPAFPNRVDSGSGYSNSNVTDGLIKGGDYDGSFTGRLTRRIWGSPYGTATIFGHQIDNRPLWSYIDTSLPGLPSVCSDAADGPDSIDDPADAAYAAAHQDLLNCLKAPGVPDSLFVSALYESPRLTIVPEYHQSAPLGNNACCYDIKDFVPVFINGLWTDNGPQWTCNGGIINDPAEDYCKHEPGRSGQIHINAVGNQRVDSANAIVLSCEILPGVDQPAEKCKKVESGGELVNIFLNLFLVK